MTLWWDQNVKVINLVVIYELLYVNRFTNQMNYSSKDTIEWGHLWLSLKAKTKGKDQK